MSCRVRKQVRRYQSGHLNITARSLARYNNGGDPAFDVAPALAPMQALAANDPTHTSYAHRLRLGFPRRAFCSHRNRPFNVFFYSTISPDFLSTPLA